MGEKIQQIFFDRQKSIQRGEEGKGIGMAFTRWSNGSPVSAVVFRVSEFGPTKAVQIIERVYERRWSIGEIFFPGNIPMEILKCAMYNKLLTGKEQLPSNVLSVTGGYIVVDLVQGKKTGSYLIKVVATSNGISNYRVGQTWSAYESFIPAEIRERVVKLFPEVGRMKTKKMAA